MDHQKEGCATAELSKIVSVSEATASSIVDHQREDSATEIVSVTEVTASAGLLETRMQKTWRVSLEDLKTQLHKIEHVMVKLAIEKMIPGLF